MTEMAKCVWCGNEAYVYEESEYKKVKSILSSISNNGKYKKYIEDFYRYGPMDDNIRIARAKCEEEVERLKKLYPKDGKEIQEYTHGLPLRVVFSFESSIVIDNEGVYYPTVCIMNNERDFLGKTYFVQKIGTDVCMCCGKKSVFNPEDKKLTKFDSEEANKLFDTVKKRVDIGNTLSNSTITIDNDKIQQYLFNMINIGKNIMFLEKKISKWMTLKNANARKVVYYCAKHTDYVSCKIEEKQLSLNKQIKDTKNQINKLLCLSEEEQDELAQKNGLNKPQVPIKPLTPKEPDCPQKPVITEPNAILLILPNEPAYEKPKFYNKRKVEIENNRKRMEYEEKLRLHTDAMILSENNKKILEKYNQSFFEYQNLMKKYQENFRIYEQQIKQYENDMDDYNAVNTKYHNELSVIVENEIEYRKQQVLPNLILVEENAMNALKNFEEQKQSGAIYDTVLLDEKQYASIRLKEIFYQKEIEDALVVLEEQYSCFKQYVDSGIIFPKYHDMIALTTIYEYFVTGRCTSFTGSDGAYNLYESETRANLIIGKLDVIIDHLEDIKKNQYTLYEVLIDIENGINHLNQKVEEVLDEFSDIKEKLGDIKHNQDISNYLLGTVAVSTAYTAYNTAKIAQYSEMTAKGQEALLFLTAIK